MVAREAESNSRGLGLLPSSEQAAVVRWPEITSDLTERVRVLCLWHSWDLRFHLFRSPGDTFPNEASRKLSLGSVPEQLGLLSRVSWVGRERAEPLLRAGVSLASSAYLRI